MTHGAENPTAKPTANPTAPTPQRSVPPSRYLVYFTIALTGCALDLWTKHVMFAWRGIPRAGNEWWIVENYFGIETALNPGALFGIGAGGSMIFAGLSIVAAAGILTWLFYGGAARDLWLTIALACITAGILGNLYDRLGFGMTDDLRRQYVAEGYPPEYIALQETAVRDWILFRWRTVERTWPNFNIADMLLVGGAGALIWRSFRQPTDSDARPPGGE